MAKNLARQAKTSRSNNVPRKTGMNLISTSQQRLAKVQETPIQLPTLPPAPKTTKPTPLLMQCVYRFQGQDPIVIDSQLHKPTPVQKYLPKIKERILQENLGRKSTLKCKSPRLGTARTRSAYSMGPEAPPTTKLNHPLQDMDVASLLSESAQKRLKRIFRKLDTDKDGHLTYPQVQRCLPTHLHRAQLTFFRVIYDVLSDSTFFGLQEFYAIAVIVEVIAKQNSHLWENLLDDVDFNYYHDTIFELLDDFHDFCPTLMGRLDYKGFLELMSKRIPTIQLEKFSTEFNYFLPTMKTRKIHRLDFLTLVPVVIYLESTFHPQRSLFRFRDHSMISTHI